MARLDPGRSILEAWNSPARVHRLSIDLLAPLRAILPGSGPDPATAPPIPPLGFEAERKLDAKAWLAGHSANGRLRGGGNVHLVCFQVSLQSQDGYDDVAWTFDPEENPAPGV